MRFLTKINRNYFYLLTIILCVISIVGYFVLHAIILNETKDNLIEKENLIKSQISTTAELPNLYPLIEVKKIVQITDDKPIIKEIYIQNEEEDESELFLEYSNQLKIKDSFYSIKIRQASFESEDLVAIIGFSFLLLLISSFGISFIITKKMNKTIWTDFELNLNEIEQFNFKSNSNISLKNSNIEEFDRLNKVVISLTEKLKLDYLALKEFTENASHEIQTPLSIALLNLEELLQEDLSEDFLNKIVSSINAVKRLSSLNKNLILLAKIENNQFTADKKLIININNIVKQKVIDFAPLFEVKKLDVEIINQQEFKLNINEQLVDILIGNLLSNAVNHNVADGKIEIWVNENELKFCNTGEKSSLTQETIFNRFVKGNSKSFGLGLAIVKNICDTHRLDIQYTQAELHCFTIKKNKE
ncbi:MAG: HAMP domain-containing sensor histidine kinase [Bacteroidota bacterium]